MTDQENDTIRFQTDQNGIALLQVNRPRSRNALNWHAQEQFAAAVASAAEDQNLRALIITGSGQDAFVSGGDLKELYHDHDPASGQRLNRVMTRALADLRRLPAPVIAAINGNAFGGGCEIITACDLRIAAAEARFSFAQVRNGLTTGWGGTGRLVQLIGLSRAAEIILSGRIFDAHEAQRIGLVHRLVTGQDPVLQAAQNWALELAELPAETVSALKRLLYAASSTPAGLQDLETTLFLAQWAAPAHLEALAAFAEKRLPNFNQQAAAEDSGPI